MCKSMFPIRGYEGASLAAAQIIRIDNIQEDIVVRFPDEKLKQILVRVSINSKSGFISW